MKALPLKENPDAFMNEDHFIMGSNFEESNNIVVEKFRLVSQEREEKARENIETLNAEIQTMTKTIEEYIARAEDVTLMQARKDKEELVMQVQDLKEDVKRLTKEGEGHSQQIDRLRGRGGELTSTNLRLKNELQAKTSALNRETRRKERSEREVKSLKAANDHAEERLDDTTAELTTKEEEVAALREDLARQKRTDEKMRNKMREMKTTLTKYQDDLEAQAEVGKALKSDLEEKMEELEAARGKIDKLRSEVAEKSDEVGAHKGELEKATELVAKLEEDKAKLKGSVSDAKKRIGGMTQSSMAQKIKVKEKSDEVSALQQKLNKNLGNIKKLQASARSTN